MPSPSQGDPNHTSEDAATLPHSGGQGRVRDPSRDGRLKANKARGVSKGTTKKDETVAPGGQGRVKDPNRDRRLKKNQESQ